MEYKIVSNVFVGLEFRSPGLANIRVLGANRDSLRLQTQYNHLRILGKS